MEAFSPQPRLAGLEESARPVAIFFSKNATSTRFAPHPAKAAEVVGRIDWRPRSVIRTANDTSVLRISDGTLRRLTDRRTRFGRNHSLGRQDYRRQLPVYEVEYFLERGQGAFA